MATRLRLSTGDALVKLLREREVFVEKWTKDDSMMVRKAARRDVVFSKLLRNGARPQFTLAQRLVTCTQFLHRGGAATIGFIEALDSKSHLKGSVRSILRPLSQRQPVKFDVSRIEFHLELATRPTIAIGTWWTSW